MYGSQTPHGAGTATTQAHGADDANGPGPHVPTFFELYAAERLVTTLQDALSYALSVYGQRSELCRRLLERQDECFFLVRVLIESASLRSTQASFSEAVYGMRRVARTPYGGEEGGSRGGRGPSVLTPSQRRLSLMLLTLSPFLKAKLMAVYKSRAGGGEEGASSTATIRSIWGMVKQGRYARAATELFYTAFPAAYTATEAVDLGYKLMYLLHVTPYYSPLLHVLGLRVARVSAEDAAALRRSRDARRHAQLGESTPLQRAYLACRYFLSDHATSFVIIFVFGFKIVEWWYTSAEETLLRASQGRSAVPPPPPGMAPSKGGMCTLPKDRRVCPLCRRRMVNATMVSPTGYVYCYACIFKHVEKESSCPVTGKLGITKSDLRRLFAEGIGTG